MKKEPSKKLALSKIKIARLTNKEASQLIGGEVTHTCSIRICETNFTGCSNLPGCTGPTVCVVE
ncbi:class I lanthipeptide [Chitinophaga japonensis]|uniref:Uncharacterized protein n=1 Tax=Chitinophaga japonensis TaxID=104662 RepID=A0A562SPI2_CHIJA|nr:hypothetical protein LX66_5170 [Chitinophaga japonensis]